MIFYGEYEILVDDSNQFAERARAAGVDLDVRSLPEGQRATSSWGLAGLPKIDAAVVEMGAWLRSKIGLAVASASTAMAPPATADSNSAAQKARALRPSA